MTHTSYIFLKYIKPFAERKYIQPLATQHDLLFHTHKCESGARLGINLKVKGPCAASTSGKVHVGYLIKADVQGRLVHEDEATLQGIQQPSGCLVGTADSLSS